jgi:DNA-directed RNA polymerase specialized sigma subunit
MKLENHIKKNFDDNQSYFARSMGVSQSQVSRWIKRGSHIINGELYCKASKQKVTQVADC